MSTAQNRSDRVVVAIDPHKASWTAAAVDGSLQVPAKLAARVRLLSTGHGRKSDEADAVSVAVAALNAARLRSVQVEDSILALRAVVDHRDDLIKQRTRTSYCTGSGVAPCGTRERE